MWSPATSSSTLSATWRRSSRSSPATRPSWTRAKRDGATAEIRAWQLGAASKYEYDTEVLSSEAAGADRYLVTGRLTGNFPGGTVDLRFDFTVAGDLISRLVIAP